MIPALVISAPALATDQGSLARVTTWPTLHEAVNVLSFRAGYNTMLVITGTMLLGLAASLVGVLALMRKRSLMADTLSHASLPGIALAFILATQLGLNAKGLPLLLAGATCTGVLGVLAVQWLKTRTRLKEDACLGAILSTFFGLGIVLLSIVQTMRAGNAAGLPRFIYGQTAAMLPADALLMSAIAGLSILAVLLLSKEFAVIAFDDEFSLVQGWPVSRLDLAMMALIVLVTVSGLQAVGLILVVAMLIIPPVAARFWTDRLWMLFVLAACFGTLSGYLGSSISALFPGKPAGSVIVLTSGVLFLVSMVAAPRRGIVAGLARRVRLRLRFEIDHVCEAAYEHSLESDRPVLTHALLQNIARTRGLDPLTRAAVAIALRVRDYVRSTPAGLEPTPVALSRGARVWRNHRLWEQYLITHADIAPSHVDWSVDQVEHVLSADLIRQLEDALSQDGIDLGDTARSTGAAP